MVAGHYSAQFQLLLPRCWYQAPPPLDAPTPIWPQMSVAASWKQCNNSCCSCKMALRVFLRVTQYCGDTDRYMDTPSSAPHTQTTQALQSFTEQQMSATTSWKQAHNSCCSCKMAPKVLFQWP